MKSLKLFCLPCSGASATSYLRWRRILPAWIQVEPVELPGRGSRASEPLFRDFDALADSLTRSIARSVEGDYAIFGHSLGGILAYECTHRLIEKHYVAPRALEIACSPAPKCRSFERFESLNSDEELIAELRSHNGTPEEIFDNPEMLRLTLDVLSADFAACASFRDKGRPPLTLPVNVFGGCQDDIPEPELEAWKDATVVDMTLDMFNGSHFFFREQETVFLALLESKLRNVMASEKVI